MTPITRRPRLNAKFECDSIKVRDAKITAVYLRWSWMRAVLHRGYWLIASLYLVIDADLSAFQLVFLGTAQGLTSPYSRRPPGCWPTRSAASGRS
ncbi:MAG: hypothetical protein WKH64_10190 [Chloroflexia bacterium]